MVNRISILIDLSVQDTAAGNLAIVYFIIVFRYVDCIFKLLYCNSIIEA